MHLKKSCRHSGPQSHEGTRRKSAWPACPMADMTPFMPQPQNAACFTASCRGSATGRFRLPCRARGLTPSSSVSEARPQCALGGPTPSSGISDAQPCCALGGPTPSSAVPLGALHQAAASQRRGHAVPLRAYAEQRHAFPGHSFSKPVKWSEGFIGKRPLGVHRTTHKVCMTPEFHTFRSFSLTAIL